MNKETTEIVNQYLKGYKLGLTIGYQKAIGDVITRLEFYLNYPEDLAKEFPEAFRGVKILSKSKRFKEIIEKIKLWKNFDIGHSDREIFIVEEIGVEKKVEP